MTHTVRSQWCNSSLTCTRCPSLANSKELAQIAGRWNAKLDGLMYLNLKMEGPSEAEVDAFRLEVEQRDYVQLLGDVEVRYFLDEEDTRKLAKKVNERWGKVRNGNQGQASKQIYELTVKPLHDKAVNHGWSPTNHKLCNTFARELVEGTVSRTQLRLANFVLSDKFKKHDILPGILAATTHPQRKGGQGARYLPGIRGKNRELVQRASWYLVNVMGASVASLRALNMSLGRSQSTNKYTVPDYIQPKDKPRIFIPRSYNSICFPGVAP